MRTLRRTRVAPTESLRGAGFQFCPLGINEAVHRLFRIGVAPGGVGAPEGRGALRWGGTLPLGAEVPKMNPPPRGFIRSKAAGSCSCHSLS